MSEAVQHIICPSCGGTNRVPTGRDPRQARCGRCGTALFSGAPMAATAATFDKQISRSDVPVVVDFWADWCGPCHAMAPIYEQVARELEPRMRFLKLDTEAEPAIAGRYNIRGIPTLIVFKHGKVLAQRAGVVDATTLKGWLAPLAG
ncbi:MAG TPA: thioredoxin TrxC [Devosiaceae bacterium]|jgi:thioredoxin 2|nr:thioredoxin TrxC [Devosiaceae bacterium]